MVKKLEGANVIALTQDALSLWKPKLICLSEVIQPKVFVFGGTDIAFTDDDLNDLYTLFPNTVFLATNYIGNSPRTFILPLGNRSFDKTISEKKRNTICITYCLPDSEEREEFYTFLKNHPVLEVLCVPKLPAVLFNKVLAQSFFSVCCCGNGYDTYRFWESLCNKAIPIVKKNVFFERLSHQYPQLPFVCIDTWDDLFHLIPTLTEDYYKQLWSFGDTSCIWQEHWDSKLSEFVNTPSAVSHHAPHFVGDSVEEDYY